MTIMCTNTINSSFKIILHVCRMMACILHYTIYILLRVYYEFTDLYKSEKEIYLLFIVV